MGATQGGSGGHATLDAGRYAFDAFVTYATDPDRDLVRTLEAFVEGFHRRPSLPGDMRRELELCLDGRDFVIPRRARGATADPRAVSDIVEAYMRRSRSLLVLCGPSSNAHPWIDHEVRWWLENRPGAPTYFGLTHGPSTDGAAAMPAALREAGGGDLPIYFDLRGFHAEARWPRPWSASRAEALRREASSWRSVRPFREEAARVAARLLSDVLGHDRSMDDVEAAFAEGERRAARRRRWTLASGLVATLAAAAVGWRLLALADSAKRDATVEAQLQRARVLADAGGSALPTALAYAASAYAARPDGATVAAAFGVMQDLVPIERVLRPDGGEPTWTAHFVDDGRLLLAGGRSGVLRALDARDGAVGARVDLGPSAIRQIVGDPASDTVYVGTDRGVVRLSVHRSDGSLDLAVTGRALERARIGGLVVDGRRGRVLAGILATGEIWSFPLVGGSAWTGTRETATTDPRFAEDGESDVPSGVYGLGMSGDDLVAAGIDGVVSVFRAADLAGAPRQFVHPRPIFAMATSDRGGELAVADEEGGLSVYDVATGTLLRADNGQARAAGVARSLEGDLRANAADRSPDVGVAISPDGAVLAVTSQDRSVRFLSFPDLSPLGLAVHRGAPRGVAFARGGEAVTVGDDGDMQVVRPEAWPEAARVVGVAGFAALPGGRIAAWPTVPPAQPGLRRGPEARTTRRVALLDPASGRTSAGGMFENNPSEVVALEAGLLAYWSGEPTGTRLLPTSGEGGCGAIVPGLAVGDGGPVEAMSAGPEPGTLATVTKGAGDVARTLRVWDLSSCAPRRSWPASGAAVVARGAVATVEGATRVVVRVGPSYEPSPMTFADPVTALDLGEGGRHMLVALGGRPAVCLCESGRRSDAGGICRATSATYACRAVGALLDGPQGPEAPSSVHLSPTGTTAIVGHRSGVQLAGGASSGWKFRPVGPERLRPSSHMPPFAFDPSGRLLAVVAGETGARLLDVTTGRAVAEFPTTARVNRIAFTAGPVPYLVTLDGTMLRVWDWRPEAVRARICERWAPGVAGADGPDAPPALSRAAFCGTP